MFPMDLYSQAGLGFDEELKHGRDYNREGPLSQNRIHVP